MKVTFWRRWLQSIRGAMRKPLIRARRRTALVVERLEDRVVPSLTPQMIQDMDPSPPWYDWRAAFTTVGTTTYFAGADASHGLELWKSDGTSAGTTMVADINLGGGSSSPRYLSNVNGTLLFFADDGVHGNELWTSDGTAGGTKLVKDINPGKGGATHYNENVAVLNGNLYFTATDNVHGYQLWKSDGTTVGTTMVSNVNGTYGLNPFYLTAVKEKNQLFFSAGGLWVSDGTTAGTVKLYGNSADNLTDVNGTLYFNGYDNTNGFELWTSDGTVAGTAMVKDLNPGITSSYPNNSWPSGFTYINGKVFFSAYVGSPSAGGSYKLWTTDGTAAGTVEIGADVEPIGWEMTELNGALYFIGYDSTHGYALWTSNGTDVGTTMVKDVNPGLYGPYRSYLTKVNGTLFFVSDDGAHGIELWKSDGSSAGTVMVKDINPGSGDSTPFTLTESNGKLFFWADDGSGYALWYSDGTASGTTLVKNIERDSGNSYAGQLTAVNGSLYFTTYSGSPTLWKTDGAKNSAVRLGDFSGGVAWLTDVNGTLFFTAYDPINGYALWTSDGTAAGTVVLGKNIDPSSLTKFNGQLYFAGYDATNGDELWKSDGTAAGTIIVKDIRAGAGGSYPGQFTNVNGTLFFVAYDDTNGGELWKTDGTAAGTKFVKDIHPGAASSNLANLTAVNGILFFTADDGVNGVELWKSDGTATGTMMVQDIYTGSSLHYYPGAWGPYSYSYYGPNSSSPSDLTNVNGTLYFTADDGVHGREVWKSDGNGTSVIKTKGNKTTTTGTVLVADIVAGSASSNPTNLINMNGKLYFSANDGKKGQELWTTDGTAADTTIVADINQGSGSSSPNYLTNINGVLFFVANDGVNPAELWRSDGTTAGTTLVKQFTPDVQGYGPHDLINVGGSLFLVANDGVHGDEPWVLPSVTVAGPTTGLLNQTLTFTLDVTGASADAVFTYHIDWNGDNVVDQTVTGTTGMTVSHSFSSGGLLAVGVTATDASGGTSDLAATMVNILPASVAIQTDPADSSKQMLFIDGSAANDNIVVTGTSTSVSVSVNGTSVGTYVPGAGSSFALVAIFGEGGNDTLDARGLSVSSVLEGGAGADTLYGGSAPNLLGGGLDADTLYAGGAGDILFGGVSTHDANLTALAYIMAEWNRTDVDYATRISHLTGSLSGGMNGAFLLNSTTTSDDNATDTLNAGAGLDWYFAHLKGNRHDLINNQASGEVITGI